MALVSVCSFLHTWERKSWVVKVPGVKESSSSELSPESSWPVYPVWELKSLCDRGDLCHGPSRSLSHLPGLQGCSLRASSATMSIAGWDPSVWMWEVDGGEERERLRPLVVVALVGEGVVVFVAES